MLLKTILKDTEAVWYDPGFVPVHASQRLVGVKTNTDNFTIYLFDHDGERVGWVSGDAIADAGVTPDLRTFYAFVVKNVLSRGSKGNPLAQRGKLSGNLYEITGIPDDAQAFRGKEFPKELIPFDFNSEAYSYFTGKFFNTQPDQFEETIMTRSNTTPAIEGRIARTLSDNGDAMKNAGYLEAGYIVNEQLAKIVAAKAPFMVKGYVDTPIGKLVIANLFKVIIHEMRGNDAVLQRLSDASLEAAHLDLIRTLNIAGLIDELLSMDTIKNAMSNLKGEQK